MARRKTDYEWAKEKLDRLVELARLADPDGAADTHGEGPWTVLKLLCFYQLHGVYLPLMNHQREQGRVNKLYYIDLNAGTGVVAIEKANVNVAGSALIAANLRRLQLAGEYPYDYDHYIFVEPDAARAAALRERLLTWLPEDAFTLYETGADDAVAQILERLEPDDHYLCTFDPYGFQQGTWQSYGQLIDKTGRGDLIVNFQTTSVKRTKPVHRRAFFGPNYPGGYKDLSEEEILAAFQHDILHPHRPVTDHVRIRGSGHHRYYYDMVYAVARTGSGSRFMNAFQDIDRRVGKFTGDDILRMLTNQGLSTWF